MQFNGGMTPARYVEAMKGYRAEVERGKRLEARRAELAALEADAGRDLEELDAFADVARVVELEARRSAARLLLAKCHNVTACEAARVRMRDLKEALGRFLGDVAEEARRIRVNQLPLVERELAAPLPPHKVPAPSHGMGASSTTIQHAGAQAYQGALDAHYREIRGRKAALEARVEELTRLAETWRRAMNEADGGE